MTVIQGNDRTVYGERASLLLLSSEFPPGPGGIGTHAYELARHLSARGWDMHVAAPQPYVTTGEATSFRSRQPFTMTVLDDRDAGPMWWSKRIRDLRTAVRQHRPAIIIGSGSRALWSAAALSILNRLPWVAIGHGTEFKRGSRAARLLTARSLAAADVVVAVSQFTADLIRANGHPQRLAVIPNAADGDLYRPGGDVTQLRQDLGVPSGRVLLTVGNVSERKAQDVVIRALPRILAACPDVTYVIAGLPSRREQFGELAAALGVESQVRFTGAVDRELLPQLYNLADLFVLVSRAAADGEVEGYGIVVQEAALCGTPAVVSQGCGLTEAIVEGETGLSVPPDDPDATAEAIVALLSDPQRCRAMGRRARALASRTTWAQRVEEYDRLLQDVLTRSGAPLPATLIHDH